MATARDRSVLFLELIEVNPGCGVNERTAHGPQATGNQMPLTLDDFSRAGGCRFGNKDSVDIQQGWSRRDRPGQVSLQHHA